MKTQMWHPEFKLHEHGSIPDLPLAALPQQPQHAIGHKSSTVSEFVAKMGQATSIVQQALRLSQPEEEEKKSDEYSAMSTKYGISAETLRLIQKKQLMQEATRAEISAAEEPDKVLIQELSAMQDELRQIFTSKQKQVLPMADVLQSLTATRTHKGKFQTRGALQKHVSELGSLVPELLEVKTFKGRQMLRFRNRPSCDVIQ